MAYLVKNISAGAINIPDMGLTLEVGEEYDLTLESPNDVATSANLAARIGAAELVILDPLDGVTQLSTVDSLEAVSRTGLPNFRSFGTDLNQLTDVSVTGELTNQVIKYTGAGFENQDLLIDELGDVDLTGVTDGFVLTYQAGSPNVWIPQIAEDKSRMNWAGNWAQTDYLENDVVTDGAWLMIANKDTGDRAGPQPDGDPEWALQPAPAWDAPQPDEVAVVYSGHKYVFNRGCWLQRLRVWIPTVSGSTNYRFLLINVTNPSVPLVTIVPEGILFPGQWTTIVINNYVVTAGSELLVLVDGLNTGSNTLVNGGWRFDGTSQNSGPAAEGFNGNNQGTTVRFDYTDLDSTDRTSELQGVIAGSTILISQTSNPNNYVEYITLFDGLDQGTYIAYTTAATDAGGSIGSNENCTVTITVPVAQATDYVQETDYWLANQPTYATVEGYLAFDGVEQAGVEDDAFGIDLYVQKAYISNDWDYMSLSSNASGSGGGGEGGIGEAPEDGTPYSRQDAAWVSSTLAGLTDTTLTAPANGQILQYSAGQWINVTSSATDELVKVSANDTTAGYLNGKLVAGAGISLTENNDAGNETFTVANTAPAITDHTLLSNIGVTTHANIDLHIGDATIHFTEASIDHTAITNIGTNSHAAIDTHIADGTIHFTEASIDHTAITNIGTNSHAAIDLHIAAGAIHFTEASIDHTAITNIGTNSHADIDTHIADGTIHFTQGSIDHTNISNIGVTSHADLDLHVGDATIHFTEASITHANIIGIGTNTHPQIDNHIADATIHFTEASISHTNITNIGTNSHPVIDTHLAAVNNPHSTTVSNLDDTTITAPADNDILIYDTGEWINTASSNLPAPVAPTFCAQNGAVTQVMGTTYITNLFGTTIQTTANYSYSNGEVTVTAAGWYTIEYNVTNLGTGGTRRESECKLQLNGVDVAGTFSRGYHRNSATAGDTNVCQIKVLAAANDVFRVQTHTTGGNVTTMAQGCRLNIIQG